MKCPNCGREITENDKFCKYCGCYLSSAEQVPTYKIDMNPPPVQKSRFRDGFRAILFCFMLVFVLFGCQSCVTSGYTVSLMSSSFASLTSPESMEKLMEDTLNAVLDNTTMILFISNLLTVFILCVIFRMRGRDPRAEVSAYTVNPFRIPTFALYGLVLNVFVSITLSYLPLSDSLIEQFNASYESISTFSTPLELAFTILSVAVVTGIAEELVFRGAAMKRLIPVFGKGVSVVITALIFGMSHGTPIAMGYAFIIGLLFGYMYVSYGSIVPSLVCHIFFNLTSYILPYAPDYTIIFIYIISASLLILLSYRIFVRRPVFSDVVYDRDERIPQINEREKEIVTTLRTMQRTGEMDSDDMLELMEAWEENRNSAKNKKEKSNKKDK